MTVGDRTRIEGGRWAQHVPPAVAALYPEVAAGGFTRADGTVGFYARVNALLEPLGSKAVVVDYGAGRGAVIDDPVDWRRQLRIFRGRAGRVIGLDVDSAVLENPVLDEAHLIAPGGPLPLDDESVHLIVSDHTFEHVEDPRWVAGEFNRVLRPGGWVCARTPNRWGYIGVGARLVPNRFHERALHRLQPAKPDVDTFPTRYQLNTRKAVYRWFPPNRFEHHIYTFESEPSYIGSSRLMARVMVGLGYVTPAPFRSKLFIFMRKR